MCPGHLSASPCAEVKKLNGVVRPQDIILFVEEQSGHPLNPDEGITWGPRTREISGITVCWSITPTAVEAAATAGHNCLVHHEWSTFFPQFHGTKERYEWSWPANHRRLDLLSMNDLTAMRLHGSVDQIAIF